MSGERAFEAPGPKAGQRKGMGRSTALLLGVTVVFGSVFLATAAAAGAWLMNRDGKVNASSFLDVSLSGTLSDAPEAGGLVFEPEKAPPVLTEIAGAIRHAKDDPRITGLYLNVAQPSMGWAGAQELRDAIVDFRASGKPCVAYAETWTTGGYFVASACDTVAVAPAGILLVNGLAVHITYYVGLFEKIGVQADMLHVGDFKSAVEPYERTGPSEPASEAMNLLLDSLWTDFLTPVAEGRKLSVPELSERVDHPSLSPERAQKAGLVDLLAYPDQLRSHIELAATDRDAWLSGLADAAAAPVKDEDVAEKFTKLSAYVQELRKTEDDGSGTVAVVFAEGQIVSGDGDGGLFGGQALGDESFVKWMDAARTDDDVKAVVLRVNSPGGSALASDQMWRAIQRVKASGKPVVVSMGNYAASGGYYISAPADWIIAQPNTLTGSIGVFGGKMTFNGTYEKLGLTEYVYERGAEADLLSVTERFTEEGRVSYQGFIEDFYQTFLTRVADGRHLDKAAVHEVAQGRVWSGRQALERHLVDELGGLPEAIAKAAELGKIEGTPSLSRYPQPKGLLEVLAEMDEQGSVSAPELKVAIPGVDPDAVAQVLALERVFDGGAVALLPGDLRVSE